MGTTAGIDFPDLQTTAGFPDFFAQTTEEFTFDVLPTTVPDIFPDIILTTEGFPDFPDIKTTMDFGVEPTTANLFDIEPATTMSLFGDQQTTKGFDFDDIQTTTATFTAPQTTEAFDFPLQTTTAEEIDTNSYFLCRNGEQILEEFVSTVVSC